MAKLSNIEIYQMADAGVRTFKCARTSIGTLTVGLNRRGYSVKRTRNAIRRDEVIFTICKKGI